MRLETIYRTSMFAPGCRRVELPTRRVNKYTLTEPVVNVKANNKIAVFVAK